MTLNLALPLKQEIFEDKTPSSLGQDAVAALPRSAFARL